VSSEICIQLNIRLFLVEKSFSFVCHNLPMRNAHTTFCIKDIDKQIFFCFTLSIQRVFISVLPAYITHTIQRYAVVSRSCHMSISGHRNR
jgi:hypothetical protein